VSKYKYLTLSKLREIRDNPTNMNYEDKYCDDMQDIIEAIGLKEEKELSKTLHLRNKFTTEYPLVLTSPIASKEYIRECDGLYYLNTLCIGDIFELNNLITKLNNSSNMMIQLKDN